MKENCINPFPHTTKSAADDFGNMWAKIQKIPINEGIFTAKS